VYVMLYDMLRGLILVSLFRNIEDSVPIDELKKEEVRFWW
jgi:hypothetical protein